MKVFFSIALFSLGTVLSGVAQPKFKVYPDSIRVEMPDLSAVVVFELREYPKSESIIRDFSKTLRDVLDNVKKSTNEDLEKSEPLRIEWNSAPEGMKEVGIGVKPYGERQQMTIRPVAPLQTTLTIVKDRGIVELLPPGWEMFLKSKDYQIKVYASTFAFLDSIPTQDFGIVADAIKKDLENNFLGRKSIEAQMVIQDHQISQKAFAYIHPGDQIFLSLQGGVGLVHNIIYPELSLKLGLSFRDRSRRANFRTSLIANQLFFAESTPTGFTTNPNTFVSGAFEVNFNRKTSQPSWSGLGIGFLVNRSGDYFTGNTAKFFITHSIPNSRFSMVPEFYLTDDFKKFTFGMTLKYSF